MKAFHFKRLLKLADFLHALPRRKFDYWIWCAAQKNRKGELCGTQACALGWAVQMPAFKRLGAGLRLVPQDTFGGKTYLEGQLTLHGQGSSYLDISDDLFGLRSAEAAYLFIPGKEGRDVTPKVVARKIRKFVADKKAGLTGISL